MNYRKIMVMALMAALMSGPVTAATDQPGSDDSATMRELEQQIEQARQQLDQAAQRIAALYTEKYGAAGGKKKAMLGILLGDKKSPGGVEIVGVTPGGGAEAAGLAAGDVIVRIGDEDLRDAQSPMHTLSRYMKQVAPGDTVLVEFERDGANVAVDIITQAHGAHAWVSAMQDMDLDIDLEQDLMGKLDFSTLPGIKHKIISHAEIGSRQLLQVEGDLARYFEVDQGVVVVAPSEGSTLRGGDVLLRIGDTAVTSVEDALQALEQIDGVAEVRVQRQGKQRTLKIKADELAASGNTKRIIRIKHPDGDSQEQTIVEILD